MTWINDIPNTLWHVTNPLPAYIAKQGGAYVLYSGSYTYSTSSLSDAQEQYVIQATSVLVATIQLTPQVPALGMSPSDGEIVAIHLSSGSGYAIGVWSFANQNVTVSAQTIPVSSIAAWSALPAT